MKKHYLVTGILCAAMAAVVALPALAQRKPITAEDIEKAKPTATLEFEAESIRLIIGGSKGKGVLTFQGKKYPFTAKGGSVGGVGVTKAAGVGDVYFLTKIEDFAGTYSAATIGATAVKGVGGASFENDKGVYIRVKSKSEGLALSLGLSIIEVEMVK